MFLFYLYVTTTIPPEPQPPQQQGPLYDMAPPPPPPGNWFALPSEAAQPIQYSPQCVLEILAPAPITGPPGTICHASNPHHDA